VSSNRRDYVVQRSETLVIPVMSTWVESEAANYDIDLPLGCYFLTLLVSITDPDGSTSATIALYPYLDAAKTIVGEALSLRGLDESTSGTSKTLPASSTIVGYAIEANVNPAVGGRIPLSLPFGLRMTWNFGNTHSTTTLSIKLAAARDA